MGRWDHVLDAKPQELKDYVLDEVAKRIVEEVLSWPPRVESWADDELRSRYEPVLSRPGVPPTETWRVALEMARLEMLRDYELIDRFVRSPEYRRHLPSELEQQSAHFLTRYVVDSALDFQEFGQGKFKRSDLVVLVEKLEHRILRGNVLRF
jgi:hypothetical protein